MTTRAREADAAEFLRKALAAEGVPKLDMLARAAGLLGEHQRITDAKPFRRAKISLGIRSVRDGFGAGGGWLWELPPRSDLPAPISDTAEEERSGPRQPVIPCEWVEGVARLEQSIGCPLTFRVTAGASS
jgi:plasmid stability protein